MPSRSALAARFQPASSVWPVLTPSSPRRCASRVLLVCRSRGPGIEIVRLPREAAEDRRGHVQAREREHVPRRGVRAGLVEPVRRAIDRVAQAEPARLGVHEHDEARDGIGGHRPAEPLRLPGDGGLRRRLAHGRVREHDRRVVRGVHDQRRQQRVHRLALAELQRHARLADRDRVAAGRDDLVEARVLEHQMRRHQLRERGDLTLGTRRMLQQDAAVAGRLDDPGCTRGHRRRPRDCARGREERAERDEQGDDREPHGAGL